jgi:chromosome segregation ATPase
MASQYDELDDRMTAVEQKLQLVGEDAAAARVLASEADRDVSVFGAKLDAHTKTLNALRETQIEHGQQLIQHGQRLASLEGRIDRLERKVDDGFARMDQEFALVNQGFAKVENQFAKLGAGMAHITTLLERIAESE